MLNTGGFCSGGIEKYMRNRDSTYILLTRDFISTMKEVYLYHRMNGGMYMNQSVTGKFIALKRKQKNLTQEQLAEKLGVSNKTISKWETGD